MTEPPAFVSPRAIGRAALWLAPLLLFVAAFATAAYFEGRWSNAGADAGLAVDEPSLIAGPQGALAFLALLCVLATALKLAVAAFAAARDLRAVHAQIEDLRAGGCADAGLVADREDVVGDLARAVAALAAERRATASAAETTLEAIRLGVDDVARDLRETAAALARHGEGLDNAIDGQRGRMRRLIAVMAELQQAAFSSMKNANAARAQSEAVAAGLADCAKALADALDAADQRERGDAATPAWEEAFGPLTEKGLALKRLTAQVAIGTSEQMLGIHQIAVFADELEGVDKAIESHGAGAGAAIADLSTLVGRVEALVAPSAEPAGAPPGAPKPAAASPVFSKAPLDQSVQETAAPGRGPAPTRRPPSSPTGAAPWP